MLTIANSLINAENHWYFAGLLLLGNRSYHAWQSRTMKMNLTWGSLDYLDAISRASACSVVEKSNGEDNLKVCASITGLFDADKELQRLAKQESKTAAYLEGLVKRLSSPNFVDKAPKAVVDKAHAQQAELQQKLNAIKQKQSDMAQLAQSAASC